MQSNHPIKFSLSELWGSSDPESRMAGSKGSGRENKKAIFSLAKLIYAILQSGRVLTITRCDTLFPYFWGKNEVSVRIFRIKGL